MTDPGIIDSLDAIPVELTPDQVSTCYQYALSVLLDLDRIPESLQREIEYGPLEMAAGSTSKLFIAASPFFHKWYGKPESLPTLPLQKIDDLPILFGRPGLERRNKQLIVQADIIASTYFLTTRYEEVLRPETRDEHGRFPGKESLPFKAGFLTRPVVDEYALLLRQWMNDAGIDVKTPGRSFSVLLTHDIDHLGQYTGIIRYLRTIAAAVRGHKHPRVVWEGPLVRLGIMPDPFDNFDLLLEMDENVQTDPHRALVKTVFFFLAPGSGGRDTTYRIHDPAALEIVRKVIGHGHDIGLHASYQAGLNPAVLAEEKSRLERVCGRNIHKNRHHFLAWREVRDGYGIKKAGLDWDATMGYADQAGFRLGVCRSIPLFDPVGIQYLGIEEHPLILMEDSLGNDKYMGLPYREAWETSQRLLHETYRHDGEFVVLWHNHSIAEGRGGYYLKLYRKLLSEICKIKGIRT